MKTHAARTDISGHRFGRWLVIDYVKKGQWNCVCDCGAKKLVTTSTLLHGKTLSCGCLAQEGASKANRTHGLTKSRAYRIWSKMKGRCRLESNPDYPNYGARGITVCERWKSFENFLADMGHPPEKHSIDRIDNEGNYAPSNCRWASMTTQARNKRGNHILTFDGKSHCIAEWAEITGIHKTAISRRIQLGWPIEQALSMPSTKTHHNKLIEYNGERLGLTQWANKLGMSKITLKTRLNRGWSLERALSNASR